MINMAKESNTINTLRLSTWNIGGIMTNVLHLQNCLRNSDICMIQEHWLYPDSLDFLSSLNKDFIGWGRSSNNLNLDSTNLEKRKRWGWNALAKELVLLNWKIWVMTSLRADSTKFI